MAVVNVKYTRDPVKIQERLHHPNSCHPGALTGLSLADGHYVKPQTAAVRLQHLATPMSRIRPIAPLSNALEALFSRWGREEPPPDVLHPEARRCPQARSCSGLSITFCEGSGLASRPEAKPPPAGYHSCSRRGGQSSVLYRRPNLSITVVCKTAV